MPTGPLADSSLRIIANGGPRIGYRQSLVESPGVEVVAEEGGDPTAKAFLRGDPDALRAAYDEHGPLIYNYCRKALGTDAAHDVTQEVFLSAWRAHHTFKPERGSLGGWLMGITKNRIIDRHRKNARQVPRSDNEYLEPSTPDKVDAMANRMMLVAALGRLPERQRKVMHMAFFDDLTQVQISEKSGMPLGTVKSDMRRGLEKLKRDLEDHHAE